MALSTTKVADFISQLDSNTKLKSEFEAHPEKTLKKEASEDPKKDVWAYRIVVISLSIVIISIVIGALNNITALQGADKVITIIASLGSAAIGALAGLLAPSPTRQSD